MKGGTVAIIIGVVILVIVGIVVAVVLTNKSKDANKMGEFSDDELDALKEEGYTDEELADPEAVKAEVKATIAAARKLCRKLCKGKYSKTFQWGMRAKCRKKCKSDAIKHGIEYIKQNY